MPPATSATSKIDLTDSAAGGCKGVTHGAALPRRRGDLLAVREQFALDLFTQRYAVLAGADATRFWSPDLFVLVRFAVHGAALTFLGIYD